MKHQLQRAAEQIGTPLRFILLTLLICGHPLWAMADSRAAGTEPVTGRDQSVLAQGIVSLPTGSVAWNIVQAVADPVDLAKPVLRSPGFLVADEGMMLISDAETGQRQLLAGRTDGEGSAEALFVPPGTRQSRAPLEMGGMASYFEVTLIAADATGMIGDQFSVSVGEYPLRLLQGDLLPGETATILASDYPVLLVSTAGSLDVQQTDGPDGILQAREAVRLAPGQATTVHATEQYAVYLAAILGPALAIPVATPTPSVTPLPASPTPTDFDQDGLTDDQEAVWGTNPHNPDSDGDGLSDGDEVLRYGTNPLSSDTDGDGVSDYSELMELGTNPAVPNTWVEQVGDSDGDGVPDDTEYSNGTDPYDPDSY